MESLCLEEPLSIDEASEPKFPACDSKSSQEIKTCHNGNDTQNSNSKTAENKSS